MARKVSFKSGTVARRARGKMAEGIARRRGMTKSRAFRIATSRVKKMSPAKRRKTARAR